VTDKPGQPPDPEPEQLRPPAAFEWSGPAYAASVQCL